jgi:hypothetical protein
MTMESLEIFREFSKILEKVNYLLLYKDMGVPYCYLFNVLHS